MKLFTKKQIMSAIKITVLSAILVVGLNYANAAWSGPTATAPDGNTPAPINIGITSQIKNGGLGVNTLSVFGDGLFTGKATANRFCFADGVCISSWPEACSVAPASQPVTPTVTLTANPTSVAYSGNSTLTWSSTNATSCTASGAWSGTKAISNSSGESTGNLTSTQTYTITCTGVGGSTTASATITVAAPACTKQLWCRDADGDSYTTGNSITACAEDSNGYGNCSAVKDCNDSNSLVWRPVSGYLDQDGDGYGAGPYVTCGGSGNYVSNNTDCNDNVPSLWRNATVYVDQDGDGYGGEPGMSMCVGSSIPTGYVSRGGDCYDTSGYGSNGQPTRARLAFPGQTQGFAAPRGDGSYDYDCDGVLVKTGIYDHEGQTFYTIPPGGTQNITGYIKNGNACQLYESRTAYVSTKVSPWVCSIGTSECGGVDATTLLYWFYGDSQCISSTSKYYDAHICAALCK